MTVRPIIVLALLPFVLLACGGGGAPTTPNPLPPPVPPPPPPAPNAAVQPVFTQVSFTFPLAMLQAPGDVSLWYIVEQRGVVRMFDNDANVVSSSVYLDISARVDSSANEAGLLGMAFHPDFQNNGQVFLSYTRGGPLTSVIARFTVDANTGLPDPGSEFVILTVPQPFDNHNGGNIAFGPDGYLYIGFGDGGGGGDPDENGQDTNNFLGAIVRVDVDGASPYAIPGDNPFAANTNCMAGFGTMDCPEIYAWGLRNPWRFSFDLQNGDLWAADVGQDAWEEVDRVELGLNYGWDEREGAHCFEPANGCSTNNVDPITEYDHSVGQSITGGFVYRGSSIPALQGIYVFGDFISGRIWGIPADSQQGVLPDELMDTSLGIVSFAQSADGEIYVIDYGAGDIYQIVTPP
ncbi:MAG: PQQ-dependent sugar dehydrogenase [Gammaproteobacteria bacterium]|nr:PQQ-dependent sugar dehydrogenase [Gammaproteobacteria bacterium]